MNTLWPLSKPFWDYQARCSWLLRQGKPVSDVAVSDCFRFRTQATTAELWNPVTGERTSLSITAERGRTAIHLTMAPRESYFIVLSGEKPEAKGKRSALPDNALTAQTLPLASSQWTVTFDKAVGGPEEPVVLNKLTDWTKHSDPRIRYYSGTATYKNAFRLEKKPKDSRYELHVKDMKGAVEVVVNGRVAGTLWCSPWTVDVTPYVRKGQNQIELRVCNTLWNRLVGDAGKAEADRVMRQSHPLAKPADALVPSGITGEVILKEWLAQR